MPDYRFVLLYRRQDGIIAIQMGCRDYNHACTVGRRLTLPPHGHAQVWAGSRFVQVVEAVMEMRQGAEQVPVVANDRVCLVTPVQAKRRSKTEVAPARASALVPDTLPCRASHRANAANRNNWVLLMVVGLAALTVPLLTSSP